MVFVFGFMTEWFNNIGEKARITRYKFPETLAAIFKIFTLVWVLITAITTTINGHNVYS